MGNLHCGGDHPDEIAALCYKSCMPGYVHQPGLPYLCTKSFTKKSFVIAPQAGLCPADKENISGLCYRKDMPAGYTRKTLGLLDQTCPGSSLDFGVGCTRESYNRGIGMIPLDVKMKKRIAYYGQPV